MVRSGVRRLGRMGPRILKGAIPPALLASLVALVLSALGASEQARAAVVPPAKTPRAFADATYAQLATDGEQRLWLLEAGYRGHHLALALFQHGFGRWHTMGVPPQMPSDAGPVDVAAAPGTITPEPCLGFTEVRTRRPIITCHGLHRWFPRPFGHLVAPGSRLVQLATSRGRLVALLEQRVSSTKSGFQVIRTNADGQHFERDGRVLWTGAALAQLGDGTHERTDPQVEVAIETQGSAKPSRYVERLQDHRWSRVGAVLRGPGLGPLVSGPVRLGQATYMPVTDAEVEPWTFSAYSSDGGTGARLQAVP